MQKNIKNNALNNILETKEKNIQYLGKIKETENCPNCQGQDCQVFVYKDKLTCKTDINQFIKDVNRNSPQPIKKFLLQHSWLVKLAEKTNLNKRDQAQQDRIYQLRDKVFSQICQQIAKYYQAAINGDYRFDGMPTISRGIKGWAEEKIWRLLIAIGEPEHWRVNSEPSYWKEAI